MVEKPKIGRPKKPDAVKAQIGIRLSSADKAVIERAAALDRRLVSDWCRITLLDAAQALIEKHKGAE